jgi:hypothetical protein
MLYRKQDANGDYVFGGGLASYHQNNAEAVAQAVQTRLKLWEGEWFLDVTEGTPYVQGILGKHTQSTIDQLIKKRILETKGVLNIVSYSGIYNGENRNYTINATITTIYGITNVTGEF